MRPTLAGDAASPTSRRLPRAWAGALREVALRPSDVVYLAMLVSASLLLVGEDGGRPSQSLWPALVIAVVTVLVATPSLRRAPRWLLVLGAAWALGPLLALLLAEVRAGFVRPVTAWALVVPLVIATLQLLRRPWGRTAVTAIVGVTLARAWYGGLLAWWGGAGARGEPAWMVLSWHNQSGTLMAVLGVGGLGLALVRRGPARVLGVLAASAGLAATWLSGSRGAVVATVAAVIVVLVARYRHGAGASTTRPDHVTSTGGWVASLVAALGVVVFIAALSPLHGGASGGDAGGLDGSPVTSREQDAAGNLRARVGHWEAAVAMFADAPLTGTGPGSYRWSSVPVYPDDANLTSSAHSEYLQALGEQGLISGAALLGSALGLAWLVLGVLRRPGRDAVEVAAAGCVTVLAAHAAIDFDHSYPLLLALLAVAGAVLLHTRELATATIEWSDRGSHAPGDDPRSDTRSSADTSPTPRWLVATTVALTLALLATSMAALAVERAGDPPWAFRDHLIRAVELAPDDAAAARAELAEVATWNPGAPRLEPARDLVAHAAGELADEDLLASIDPEVTPLGEQVQAARQLLAADRPELAQQVTDQLRPVLDARRAWGVGVHVVDVAGLQLAAAHQQGGCDAVRARFERLEPWLEEHDASEQVLESQGPWTGCEAGSAAGG